MRPRQGPSEDGFSAIWVAFCLFFLMGAAALAVDVSGFYETARTDQTTADLACLAGVPHLPENAATARAAAAENVQRNYGALASTTPSTAGNTLTLTDGSGATVQITTPFNGDSAKMHVLVTETDQAVFGRVLGADDVPVTQEAYCKVFAAGTGDLPFGAVPDGAFDGVLQINNPCDTGNCRALDVPRSDINGSGNRFIRNVALGSDRELVPFKNPIPPGVAVTCTSSTPQCSVLDQNQGVSTGQLSDGLIREGAGVVGRLQNTGSSVDPPWQSPHGRFLDGDEPEDILGSTIITGTSSFPEQPAAWDSDVHGPFPGTPNGASMLWYNAAIANCDSPRLARIPIIAQLDWAPGSLINLPNGNSDPVKVVGFYSIIIDNPDGDPSATADLTNSDSLKTASSYVVWYGPLARCVGPSGSTATFGNGDIKTYRLVNANA
ncbi:MAG: Tad domain-containing protein [Acidimicrobiia bacterium]